MVKQEIVEGLRLATSKGESLQEAMMSFFNAGYSKEDIENAAKVLYSSRTKETQNSSDKQSPQNAQGDKSSLKPKPLNQRQEPSKKPKVIQRVSNYDEPPKQPRKILTIILIIILIILFGALIGIFLFRESLMNFFGI